MSIFRAWPLVFLLLVSCGTLSDRNRHFYVRHEWHPPDIQVTYRAQPDTEINSEPGEFDLVQTHLEANIPLPLSEDFYLYLGGYYDVRDYQDMSPDFKGLTGGDRLYRIRLNLGCGYFLKDSWLLTGAFWPEIDSDLDGTLWHKDHQQFGQILSTHQVSDSFFLKYGVAFTQEIDNRYIHAVLGCAWVPDDRWRVDVLLPTLAQVAFTPRPGTTILGGVELEGAQYQWRDPGTKHRHDQQIQEVRAYIGTETKVTDALSLLLRAGITFVGEYELRYSWRTVDGDLKPTPYFQVGLGFDL